MNQLYLVARFAINPNQQNGFKGAAADCLAAARTDGPGTLAYEWFINDSQTECIVLEGYENSQAILPHMKSAAPLIPKLMQFGKHTIEGFGTPSKDLQEMFKGRVTFTPRFQGLDAPDLRDSGGGSDILTIGRFRIHPGKEEEFRTSAAQGLRLVQANDPGTAAYEWYIDPSGSLCTVLEMYRSTEAILAHVKNVGQLTGGLLRISDLSVDLCASGSASAPGALAKLPMKRYARFQGLRP